MAKKMDGLKISIDNTDEPQKTKKKSSAPMKKVRTAKGGRSFLSPFIMVIVTAIIVGGGIYAWKDKEVERSLKDISQDARSTREEFEKRIDNLKSKITGIETENLQLKTTKEELEKKVSYLDGATKLYLSEEVGYSFLYPAIFGQVTVETEKADSGTKFVGRFSDNDSLVFGGVSSDFTVADASVPLTLFDNYGFEEKKDKVNYRSAIGDGESEFEINPAKKIETIDGMAILVDKKSFPSEEGLPQVDLGENIGAVVNMNNEDQPSLSFVNSDFSKMTLMDFEAMIATVQSSK